MQHEKKTRNELYDLTIIGGGSGGLIAARLAATLGAKVLLIDRERLGGDCLRYGCIPSKSLIHVARIVYQARHMARLGLSAGTPQVEMGRVSAYVQGVITQMEANEKSLVEGVEVRFGRAAFQTATTLSLNGETIRSRNTIIATGSHPLIPSIEGLTGAGYLTNEGVFNLHQLPASLLVVGGGPVGVELSQAFSRLGTQVTLLQGPGHVLPREDPEVSESIADVLRKEGVKILTGARPTRVHRQGTGKLVTIRCGEREEKIEADEILLAAGRQPNLTDLNLEAAGIKYTSKGITVDAYLRTSASNIFAIGDVLGGYFFTHVAAYQAGVAVRNALVTISKKRVNYRVVPWCTFTDPEVARVGLTLAEAQREHKQVRAVTFPYAGIDRAQTEDAPGGFIKLVLAGKKGEIVGAHIVGLRGGELLGELALAMSKHLTLGAIVGTIHAYPTLTGGLQQAMFEVYLASETMQNNRALVRRLLALRRT